MNETSHNPHAIAADHKYAQAQLQNSYNSQGIASLPPAPVTQEVRRRRFSGFLAL